MKKIGEIYQGIKNSIFTNTEIEELAKRRKSICDSCSFKIEKMGEEACGSCGCILHWKQRSPSSDCPQGHWKEHIKNYVFLQSNTLTFVMTDVEKLSADVNNGILCDGVSIIQKENPFVVEVDGIQYFSKAKDLHSFFEEILNKKKTTLFIWTR